MFRFKGYKDRIFEADSGWLVADENGRSGKLVSVTFDHTLGEHTLVVDPGYGAMIEIRESLVSFTASPDED